MRISGLAVRTNVPLPPPAGPYRDAFLERDGIGKLRTAAKHYTDSLRILGLDDIDRYPTNPGLRALPEPWCSAKHLADLDRITQAEWRRFRASLRWPVSAHMPSAYRLEAEAELDGRLGDAEEPARNAMAAAIDAFNFLEDHWLAATAHHWAHETAALVSGLYGCAVQYKDDAYWDTCQISLMHERSGMSMGFTAKRSCSICKSDIDECPHDLDLEYLVTASTGDEGACTLCGGSQCDHSPGSQYAMRPRVVMEDPTLHEISLVSRPRDPLARIREVELPTEFAAVLGVANGEQINCRRCLGPCQGFSSSLLSDSTNDS